MAKVPFTPAGFQELENQLYTLNDNDLRQEAEDVNANYIAWVNDHVIINTAQMQYLLDLDNLFIASLGAKAAIAFINRLPLNLVLPDNYQVLNGNDDEGKWFLDKSTIVASNTPTGSLLATGELIYEMQFE